MTTSFTQRQDCVPREHRVHDAGNYIIDIYTRTKELPNVMTVPCLCSARHDSARTIQTLFANMESVSSVRQFVEEKVDVSISSGTSRSLCRTLNKIVYPARGFGWSSWFLEELGVEEEEMSLFLSGLYWCPCLTPSYFTCYTMSASWDATRSSL